ncbi:MAG: hypothetical protein ACK5NY_00015, partial [Burkholderiaceae bacterium]
VAFSREFKLNAQMETMLYERCSGITPEDVFETRKKLTNQVFNEATKVFYRSFFATSTDIDSLNAFPDYQKNPSEIKRENDSFYKFFVNSPVITLLMARKYPTEFAALEESINECVEKEGGEIHSRLEQLEPDSPDYGQQCELLQQRFNSLRAEVSAREKETLFKRIFSENNLHADMA